MWSSAANASIQSLFIMYMRMLQRIISANKKHTHKNVRPDWMNKMKHTFKRMPPFSHQQTHTQKRPRIIDKPKCIRSVCVVYSRGRASMPIKKVIQSSATSNVRVQSHAPNTLAVRDLFVFVCFRAVSTSSVMSIFI